MAITAVKIHPAIGVARLGNSPDEFFVGPERLFDPPDPPGGFKDASCRVKRQGARFRVYAYHDDGAVEELTAADADITWTVHLVNKKAVTRNPPPAGPLTIDPGSRALDGPLQHKEFDSGQITLPGAAPVTVPLGEVRTDDDGRLLVLGGSGTSASPTGATISSFLDNAGWYDDAADGPVNATVRLHATGDELVADGAWVIVGPPSFAPQLENVISLYDRVLQMAVDQGWRSAPATVSYTEHVYPILERARTTRWVEQVFGAHTWPDPVYDPALRQAIFNRLANPAGGGSNMPQLNSTTLTPTQYDVMERWKDGNFLQDWAGPPAAPADVTPDGLDRAALQACVGAAFVPGIEAGGIAAQPIIDPGNYVGAADPLRLSHAALSPGDVTRHMALPWQADFKACGSNWWPVPRPVRVTPQGTTTALAWDRDVGSMLDMVSKWHTLGFVVEQGGDYVEVDRCDTTFVNLLTPHLDFQDVPQGPMGASRKALLAVTFEVRSTGAPVTLEVQSGDEPSHLRLTLQATSVTVGPTSGSEIATARLWLAYETGPVGETVSDQLTVRQAGATESWTVTITANTVGRKVAAAALVLDRSGSMTEDRGDGGSKYDSLKEAAAIFVDVALEGDGVGIVRYNQDAQPVVPVTPLGPAADPLDPGRQSLKNAIAGPQLTPAGATSIGDGIHEGRQLLQAAGGGYDLEALVVLTDGKENRERWIDDVAAEVDERTYAVGLGTPQNTSAPALQALAGNHGGYLLVTGAITGDNRFVLQKYFLQVLAGISSAEIVLDPDGVLVAGHEQRIPFQLTEHDNALDVVLLTAQPEIVDFRLQTPNGFILEPWRALAEPTMTWVGSRSVAYYRLVLPAELVPARFDQAGTWHALLTIGRPRRWPPQERVPQPEQPVLSRRIAPRSGPEFAVATPGERIVEDVAGAVPRHAVARAPETAAVVDRRRRVPYSLLVHTYSDLSLRATLTQSGYEPGAHVVLGATLASGGMPTSAQANVWAEVTRPDGTRGTVPLAEQEEGRFGGTFATTAAGVYRCRVRASGRSGLGYPFEREQTLTAAVWSGGDRDADPDRAGGGPLVRWARERDERLCRLLDCLLDGKAIRPEVLERLARSGVDLAVLRRCLRELCSPPGDEDDADRDV